MGATNSIPKPTILTTPKNGSLTGITEIDPTTNLPVLTRYTRIPYALPPTGPLRFQRPNPLPKDFSFSKESGEPGDYTKFGNACPQPIYEHDSVVLPNPRAADPIARICDENCLFLNVWVPVGEVPERGWPVQVFIHGGWLQVGDAMQNNNHDPYHLMQDFPRIIISMTYRLNIFGFLSCSALSSETAASNSTSTSTSNPNSNSNSKQQPVGNYGFWDQRMAIEWIHKNVYLFNGNPENISVGGLSAGAYSTIFQLYYDTYLPEDQRIIKRVYLYSNAVGIQPKPICSSEAEEQFEEICSRFEIDASLEPTEKLARLRQVPAQDIVDQILTLKTHTFRAGTDGEFIPENFLESIHSGGFARKLKEHGVSVMLGEVENEEMLYRLVNPAFSHESLILQLNNYYPSSVTETLLESGLYDIPKEGAPKEAWRDCFAKIVADCQVHATVRGFASCLLRGGDDDGLSLDKIFRYRICWRAKGLDEWLDPKVGLCHAADIPIWWLSGRRADFDELDVKRVREWLEPQHQFLQGKEVNWGTKTESQVRRFGKDGNIEIVDDELWESGLKVWEAMGKGSL